VEEGCAIPALPCKLAAVVIQNALVQGRVCSLRHHSKLVVIHRMLGEEGCYPCAAIARCCCDLTECSGGRKVCYPCAAMQARCCCDHRMLWQEGVLSCAAMQARCCCDSQNAQVERCAIPALPCKLAAMIHRMLWWKKGVLSLRHASCCCCDPQNALVQGRCAIPAVMQARCCHDPQNALGEEGVLSLRCHASSLLL
jgi:hypothetical protein